MARLPPGQLHPHGGPIRENCLICERTQAGRSKSDQPMTAKEFLLNLPGKVTHQALEGINTKFHFDLLGDGGGQFTVAVADNALTTREGLEGEPACVVKATAEDFSRLLTGELNPMMAILSGRIKISNQGEMLKMAKLFGLL